MKTEHIRPEDIEKRSFEIITEELLRAGFDENRFSGPELAVVKRCIHTTADFDYAKTLRFSAKAVDKMRDLIVNGASIVTDTNMALAGINKRELKMHGCEAFCFMADEGVAEEAKDRGLTRAAVSMERAMRIDGPVIFVVGNAPTALITLREHHAGGEYRPAFVVGVPVGFVNVVAAKEIIMESNIPYIVNEGRKGGSTVAAAIVNAVLYGLKEQ